MTLKERTPIKACPYWARVATAPNGWVIGHCSFRACKEEEEKGQVWEGPPKRRRCTLGYNKRNAIEEPAIIFCRPEQADSQNTWMQIVYVTVADQWMNDRAWNKIVEWFSREAAKGESLLDSGRIVNGTREVINQAWTA